MLGKALPNLAINEVAQQIEIVFGFEKPFHTTPRIADAVHHSFDQKRRGKLTFQQLLLLKYSANKLIIKF